MLPANIITKATASTLAKVDMGLVDIRNVEALMLSVADEIEAHSQLIRPQSFEYFSLLLGGVMNAVMYEKGMVEPTQGEYSEPLRAPEDL